MIIAFLFYNVAEGPQSWLAFSRKYKHCNIFIYGAEDIKGLEKKSLWTGIELGPNGIKSRIFELDDDFLSKATRNKKVSSIVVVTVKEKAKRKWTPWMGRTCNEICRYASSVKLGFTFNPKHLMKKLLKHRDDRNYQIIFEWSR